jgi:hypothetical protein
MDPILIFIPISVFAAIGALVVYILHKQRKREREASEELGVGELRSGSKNSPSYFLVEIPCASRGEFKIGREKWPDKIARRVGFEWQESCRILRN